MRPHIIFGEQRYNDIYFKGTREQRQHFKGIRTILGIMLNEKTSIFIIGEQENRRIYFRGTRKHVSLRRVSKKENAL